MNSRTRIYLIISCGLLLAVGDGWSKVVEQQVSQPVQQAISMRQLTQKEEEQWRAEKEKLTAQLEQLIAVNGDLTSQSDELHNKIQAAENRISAKTKELADIEQVTIEISDVVDELYRKLEAIFAESLPFLPTERQKRLDTLGTIVSDPAAAVSEKYRKVMEALLIEAEFGFTFDVYQQTININSEPVLVDIFRLGRLGLYYLTLDKKNCGFYNVATNTWQPLTVRFLPQVRKVVAMGMKQLPVELLDLPVGRLSRRAE